MAFRLGAGVSRRAGASTCRLRAGPRRPREPRSGAARYRCDEPSLCGQRANSAERSDHGPGLLIFGRRACAGGGRPRCRHLSAKRPTSSVGAVAGAPPGARPFSSAQRLNAPKSRAQVVGSMECANGVLPTPSPLFVCGLVVAIRIDSVGVVAVHFRFPPTKLAFKKASKRVPKRPNQS